MLHQTSTFHFILQSSTRLAVIRLTLIVYTVYMAKIHTYFFVVFLSCGKNDDGKCVENCLL